MATPSQASASSALPDQVSIRGTHPFTCNTCQVAFRSSDMQRAHMQTDWHRYNLKRRVASLPPLASEIFTEKVLANQASAEATAAKASFEKACAACNKTYFSANAYANHLNSQKHKSNLAKSKKGFPTPVDDDAASIMSSAFSLGDTVSTRKSEVGEEAREEFSEVVENLKHATLEDEESLPNRPSRPHHSSNEDRPSQPTSGTRTSSDATMSGTTSPLLQCLFCNYASPSFKLNTIHMTRHHGLFVPEQEFLIDAEGLLTHLHGKIQDDHQCLYCGKMVHTASGIQTHMRDRGHCMINFDGGEDMLDVGQFYDFTATWGSGPDDDSDASDSSTDTAPGAGGVKLEGAASSNKNEEDEGWETDSTLSDVPTDEITSIPLSDRSHRYKLLNSHRHHSHADPRRHRRVDGWVSHAHPTPHAVYHDDYEMHMPSGRTAGHRSLNKYYRQNLRNYPTPAERIQQRRIEAGMVNPDSDEEMDDVDDDTRGRGNLRERETRDPHRTKQLITRANGGLGMLGVSDSKKREITSVEKREKKRELRDKARYAAGNEKRGNQQKHYRDPLLQ